jgi:hypothetical protein
VFVSGVVWKEKEGVKIKENATHPTPYIYISFLSDIKTFLFFSLYFLSECLFFYLLYKSEDVFFIKMTGNVAIFILETFANISKLN